MIKDVKEAADILTVIGGVVELSKAGSGGWRGLCPFHGEKTPSFWVNPTRQRFKCFGCGESGDVVDFLKKYYNIETAAAAEMLNKNKTLAVLSPPKPPDKPADKPEVKVEIITPAPEPKITHRTHGAPAAVYKYRNQAGELLFVTCRFNLPGGKKEVLPYVYASVNGRKGWTSKGYPTPRPLYGLEKLKDRKKTVLIVEGEKTADAAQVLLPHVSVLTWCGGTGAVHNADWTPLHGRKVLIFPDNDHEHTYGPRHPSAGQPLPFSEQPGIKAAIQIAEILAPHCPTLKAVAPPGLAYPCGWDLADATDWTPESAAEYCRANMFAPEWLKVFEYERAAPDLATAAQDSGQTQVTTAPARENGQAEPEPLDPTPAPAHIPAAERSASARDMLAGNEYYRVLGYEVAEHSVYYWFFNHAKQACLRFSSSQLSREPNLLELAPANFWQGIFPTKDGKIKAGYVNNCLILEAEHSGYFTLSSMRGRGAWRDSGKVVFNTGAGLLVDLKRIRISDFETRHAYHRGEDLGMKTGNELTNPESKKILDTFELVNFDRPISQYLIAGWITLAPFCGALRWRPHLWITGPAGSGKSWILTEMVRPLLGRCQVAVQSSTTEAGIRQILKADALPIIFDEIEAENERAAERVTQVIELMRSASSEDGGAIAKGSAGGRGSEYKIRSMFALASIAQSITQQADFSRITTLSVLSPPRTERIKTNWDALRAIVREDFHAETAERLQARTLRLLPVILRNIETFSAAFTDKFGDKRAGDQIGTLLAGAFSMVATSEITAAAATEFIDRFNWSDERPRDESKDENRLLYAIVEHIIRVEPRNGGAFTRSIAELILSAGNRGDLDPDLTDNLAANTLKRIGFKSDGEFMVIATGSKYLRNVVLKGTPWANSASKVLLRIPGTSILDSERFGPLTSRAISIPITSFYERQEFNNMADAVPDASAEQMDLPF